MNRRRFVKAGTLGAFSLGVFRRVEHQLSGSEPAVPSSQTPILPNPQVGSLYPFLQKTAEHSTVELSFLHDRFRNVETWKRRARVQARELLRYDPPPCAPRAEVVERVDRGDYVREKLYFDTTPDIRVPAYLLVPKGGKTRRPAIVALHDHSGFYVWGKEKLVELDNEHPSLTAFKRRSYTGRSYASDLARRGYVVIVIDMFYWGERRMRLANDPPAWREPATMSMDDVTEFNRRCSTSATLIATGCSRRASRGRA